MRKSFCFHFQGILVMTLLAFAIGCQQQSGRPDAISWDAFVNNFMESYFALHPTFAVNAGRHEFDGKLPDWSPPGLQNEVGRLRSERQQALAFDPASLNDSQRFERDFLVARIEADLFWLETAEYPYKNPTYYSGALAPTVYVVREYAPLAVRMRAYTAYAKTVPQAVQQMRRNLRTPLPRSYIDIGKIAFGGLASYYEKDAAAVFASVSDSQLQAEFRAANTEAMQAMKGLAAWLEEQRPHATEAFAVGPELFLRMLRDTTRLEVSLEQLEKAGRQDLDRNLTALREACNAYAPGKTIPQCVEKVQAAKPDDGPLEHARRQLNDLKAFLLANDLVTIPGTEEARVAASPPFQRYNTASISIPGPYEKGLPAIYYISPPDPSWTKAEQNAYIPGKADLLFISVHEVWPGHFLERQHTKRVASKFGQLFSTSAAFGEGWGHYTEEMMWEAGLGNGDPETHIGQLLNALLRNVRYLSAIGLHTKGMTIEESERMFREAAYTDSGTARQQAARGTFEPSYLEYTLGKLMIHKLREDWTASHGGRKTWREFHDRFLSYGRAPVPLIRKEMLGPNAGSPL